MAKKRKKKFVFITGGVVSSLGKGLASASLGALLENRGLSVAHAKLDPYLNVDPGTMSPFQHGEVFVTDDGAETDLDLGHYERFTDAAISQASNTTAGRIYERVIRKERAGEYLGKTVQVIPHVTDEICHAIREAITDEDILLCEIGGTVGDIESLPFLEAIRQFRYEIGAENVVYLHLTLVPYISAAGELKTKPTQHSVQKLREIGIQPDILLCRVTTELPTELRKKIALFTNVSTEAVFASRDVASIYELPLALKEEGLDDRIVEELNIWSRAPKLQRWEEIVHKIRNPKGEVEIGVVGKYVDLIESYKSLNEALTHGGLANELKVNLRFVEAEEIEKSGAESVLAGVDGILVPGGFGQRGTEGKIQAIKWARELKLPFFGICLGMQMAVVEFARNVVGIKDAHSAEFKEKCKHPVVSLMEDQKAVTEKGGTMRLGAYACELKEGSRARAAYHGAGMISERHRHRFEVNNAYREQLSEAGLIFSGLNPELDLVEMIELPEHPYFVACQFHPEFKSKPFSPHPLFASFVEAARAFCLQKEPQSGPSLVRA